MGLFEGKIGEKSLGNEGKAWQRFKFKVHWKRGTGQGVRRKGKERLQVLV